MDSGCKHALEEYILEQKMVFDAEQRERICIMQWCEASVNQNPSHTSKLLLFTNKGVHIMRPPAGKPCSVCPPENLCPSGPRSETKFKYEKMVDFIVFPDLPQRFILNFS